MDLQGTVCLFCHNLCICQSVDAKCFASWLLSFYMVAQGGMKGTSKPVKYIMHCNENENPVNGHGGLTLQNLIKCTYQMCWKYPTATKVTFVLCAPQQSDSSISMTHLFGFLYYLLRLCGNYLQLNMQRGLAIKFCHLCRISRLHAGGLTRT